MLCCWCAFSSPSRFPSTYFPVFTIGLASYLAVLEALWLKTGRAVYFDLFKYWVKIFALVFGMGVVSGVVLSYQFGTNWSVYSTRPDDRWAADGYEVLTAFFLEAGFLGVMLFGLTRVGRGLHFTATSRRVGTFLSSFWILSANSWMQTPGGHSMNANGQCVPDDWLATSSMPRSPSAGPYRSCRLSHHGACGGRGRRVASAAAPQHRSHARDVLDGHGHDHRRRTDPDPGGDQHGLNTLEHQPPKGDGDGGHFESHAHGAPLVLFGWPDQEAAKVKYAISIPKASSLILSTISTHRWPGSIPWRRPIGRRSPSSSGPFASWWALAS